MNHAYSFQAEYIRFVRFSARTLHPMQNTYQTNVFHTFDMFDVRYAFEHMQYIHEVISLSKDDVEFASNSGILNPYFTYIKWNIVMEVS